MQIVTEDLKERIESVCRREKVDVSISPSRLILTPLQGQFIAKIDQPEMKKGLSDIPEYIGEDNVLLQMAELLNTPSGSKVSDPLKQLLALVINRIMMLEQSTNIKVEPLMDRNRALPHIGDLLPDITSCASTIEMDIGAILAVVHAKLCIIEAKIDAISIVE